MRPNLNCLKFCNKHERIFEIRLYRVWLKACPAGYRQSLLGKSDTSNIRFHSVLSKRNTYQASLLLNLIIIRLVLEIVMKKKRNVFLMKCEFDGTRFLFSFNNCKCTNVFYQILILKFNFLFLILFEWFVHCYILYLFVIVRSVFILI